MAYPGKYQNNLPFICAAGLRNKINYGVGDCLKQYTLEDSVDALKTHFKVPKKEYKPIKLTKVDARIRNPGIFVESKDLFCPTPLTRYRQLINDLKETTYGSYWNKKLGATADSYPAFPEGMNIEEITFGDAYNYDTTVKDLIQPPKTPYQVQWESQINHDAYKRIYNSYNPSERIDRRYDCPPFNPSQAYGNQCGYDKRGLKTKCCLEWYNRSPVTIASEIQENWLKRTHPQIGKCHDPNQVLDSLPKGHTFGMPYRRDMCGVADLVKEPSIHNVTRSEKIHEWLASYNRLKIAMEKKISPTFDLNVFYEKLKYYDMDGSGRIRFDYLLMVMKCNEIFFNIENVKALMEYLGIVQGDEVDYKRFVESFKGHLDLGKIQTPQKSNQFISTYQVACCDLVLPDENVCRPVAGIPTRRLDERKPANPFTDRYIELADFTDAKACLQPSILTQYSLSHRDMLCPRDESFIRSLFEKIGYNLSDEIFSEIWRIGIQVDGNTNMVCVQTFRDLLNKFIPLDRKVKVDGVR